MHKEPADVIANDPFMATLNRNNKEEIDALGQATWAMQHDL